MENMKILVVGGGAREHALAWALARCPSVREVHAAPGNPGIAAVAHVHAGIAADDVPGIVEHAREGLYDLVVVGPERPLALGLADELAAAGVRVFGCSREAAEIESSKGYAKEVMWRASVPTAEWQVFGGVRPAVDFGGEMIRRGGKVVVKADGLAAGKGVEISSSEADLEAAVERMLALDAGHSRSPSVVVEEFLVGREASCMALVDGEKVYALPACEDHKTIYDGDKGPMTGGMGVVCPTPVVDSRMLARVQREILEPTARQLVAEGRAFRGLLYAGVMITADGPKVLEFNCRFGDPETEALVVRLGSDLAQALLAIAEGRAPTVQFTLTASCTVVLAAGGYPGPPEKGAEIRGLDAAAREGGIVFHAGTRRKADGRLVVDGGRVLAVTGLGPDLDDARAVAYRAAEQIDFKGLQMRRDIGARRR
jgi:phosphoribosylamine--glycine ligase